EWTKDDDRFISLVDKNQLDRVTQLLTKKKIDPTKIDPNKGYSALDGKTPLALAAEKGQASICKLLIENGSDVNDPDAENRTPLLLAASKGHPSVCDYLINKGARIDALDKKGRILFFLYFIKFFQINL
ncbi:hypothetical protein HELRODRAFT_82432, partial [Helobdella robusta]|uniref:Uncharacterized protein n=1 Tax=Helobdella robusta TaxID=6412 RepID=T1G4S1_HELRO